MKRIFDNERLMLRVCNMYYKQDMTGVEICKVLGISRPTLAKLLKYAKDTGTVKITISSERQRDNYELELALEEKYGLRECIITDTVDSREKQFTVCGHAMAIYLDQILKDDDVVGVGMGVGISSCMKAATPDKAPHNLLFVPLVGGLNAAASEIHSNYLAEEFAKKYGGSFLSLFAPARVERVQTRMELMQDASIKSVLDTVGHMNVALVSIGAPTEVTSVKSLYFSDSQFSTEFYQQNNVCGDLCLLCYDKQGRKDVYDFNDTVICADIGRFRNIPYCIGIAPGYQKRDAIIGAIAGRYINVLVTDADCAKALLEA